MSSNGMDQSPTPIVAISPIPNPTSKKNLIFIIVGLVVLAVIIGGFWYWQDNTPVPDSPNADTQIDQKTADISLGSQILQRTQNLIKDRFPETNPLKNISKNPF